MEESDKLLLDSLEKGYSSIREEIKQKDMEVTVGPLFLSDLQRMLGFVLD
jgi:hypothetical protein